MFSDMMLVAIIKLALLHHHMKYAAIVFSYPNSEELETIYRVYLTPVFLHNLPSHPVWGSMAKIHTLATSMVQVFQQVLLRQAVCGKVLGCGF